MKDVLEVLLDDWVLSCKLRVCVTPDVGEWIKPQIWVTCEKDIALSWR